eukprot:SAG11_NODE_3787_length_2225_cov_14.781750_3_plen_84_part_00
MVRDAGRRRGGRATLTQTDRRVPREFARHARNERAGGTEDAARNALLLLQWRRCGKQIEKGRKEIDVGLERGTRRATVVVVCV